MSGELPSLLWVIDAGLTYFINSFGGHVALADSLMRLVSLAGVPLMVVAVAGQWWSKDDRHQTRHVLVSAGLSFLLGLAVNQALLQFVQRIRPYDVGVTQLLVAPSPDPSFPSDHATAAFAIAFTMMAFGHRGKWLYLIGAMLISLSRVYLGMHYVSDIAGGVATGIVAVGFVRQFYQRNSRADRFLTGIL